MGPLEGIRILDMTSVLMGPYATQLMGDLGADVVKVEAPEGDIVRGIGPGRSPGMGGMFLTTNRSKRSIVLDLKRPAGREAMLRLATRFDVLITNVRPLAMERLGLGYQAVAAANPALVYVALVGFGQDGPMAARPAYDDLIQGATGLASLGAGASGQAPRYAPLALADRVVGLHAFGATLAALLSRARTGRGQRVDVPMFETMASFVLGDHLSGLAFDPPLDDGGYARLLAPDRRPYETLDGHVCVLIYNDAEWRRFFTLVCQPEMLDDPRFANHGARARNIRAIYAVVADIIRTRTTADWLEALRKADIPAAPMNGIGELLDDKQLAATGFFQFADHPTEGRIRTMRVPSAWSGTPPQQGRPAPGLGEHGAEILAESGWSAAEIDALHAAGALVLPPHVPPTETP